jgi:hypothetical protein
MNRLDEIERFAFLEADDCFFPVVRAAGIGTTLAFQFPVVVRRADSEDGLAEELLDGLFDLKLVGLTVTSLLFS